VTKLDHYLRFFLKCNLRLYTLQSLNLYLFGTECVNDDLILCCFGNR